MTAYKLISEEPTEEMLREAQTAWINDPMHRTSTLFRAMWRAAPEVKQEPVAIVGSVYQIDWVGCGPIAPIIKKHNIKAGDMLYTFPPDAQAQIAKRDARIAELAQKVEVFDSARKTAQEQLEKYKGALTDAEHEIERLKRPWKGMDSAPRDRRVLVRSESGTIYAAHWVASQITGEEAYLVSEAEDGTQHLVHPVEWREI